MDFSEEGFVSLTDGDRLLLDSLGEGIYGITVGGICTFINQRALEILGYQESEVVGTNIHELIHHTRTDGTPFPENQCSIHFFRDGKGSRTHDTLYWRKDGTTLPVSASSRPILRQGKIHGAVITFTDISQDKAVQEKYNRLATNLRQILDSSGEGIIGLDREGKVSFINRAACTLLGYGEEELYGQEIHRLIHHTDAMGTPLVKTECPIYKSLAHGQRARIERDVFWRKDGFPLPVQLSADPIFEDGEIRGSVLIFTDLSKFLDAEEARQEADSFAKAMVNSLSAQIALLDNLGTVVGTNSAWRKCRFLGPAREGKDFLEFIETLPASQGEFVHQVGAAIRNVISHEVDEVRFEYPSEERWYLGTVRRLSATRIVIILDDITVSKRAMETLEQARISAEAASRAKSEFLANMSHEIRTPMNIIIGMAELLDETELDSRQKQYVDTFRTAGDHLLSLIDNILDLSKIESGRLVLEATEFDPGRLVEETAGFFAFLAHSKKLEIACRVSSEVPALIQGDPVRIRQILVNLVGNAIKFTQRGEVAIQVKIDPADAGQLLFSVSDTGVGIHRDKYQQVFSAFTQGDSSTTRRYGGTGLGLKISKRLVELMGGRIWLESEVDQGSTFYFTYPLRGESRPPSRKAELAGLKILAVDDNETNLSILQEYLTASGARVHCVQSGPQGLKRFQEAHVDGKYDLIIVDGRMPGMSGFELVRQIRREFGADAAVVMMLTSDNNAAEVNCCRELGCNAFLAKPVRKRELLATVQAVLRGEQNFRAMPSRETKATAAPGEKRILLVEDSADNVLLVQAYLRNHPYAIDVAENGEVAVAKFKAKQYDLILMDLEMPIMDGYTATSQIRQLEGQRGTAPTPIIALTAYAFADDLRKSLAAGCDDHITKPVRKEKLLQVLSEYLGGSGRSGQICRQN